MPSPDATSILDGDLVSLEGLRHHAVQREGDINQANDDSNDVADHLNFLDVALRYAEHRGDLLPSEAVVGHEHEDRPNVEQRPHRVLEDLELQSIDVSYAHRLDSRVIGPEEIQAHDAPDVDKVRRRAHEVWTEDRSVAEAEQEQVYGHEGQQHQTSHGKVQVAPCTVLHCRSQLHVPCPDQSDKDVQQHGQQDVL